MLNTIFTEVLALAKALTELPASRTSFPVVAETASFAGIEKSFNNSVVVDPLKCEKVIVLVVALILLACAIKIIEVYPVGAVYKVAEVVVNSAVTVLNTLSVSAMIFSFYPSIANMYGVITANKLLSKVTPVIVPLPLLITKSEPILKSPN